MSAQSTPVHPARSRGVLAAVALACVLGAIAAVASAPAQDLQSQLESKQAQLDAAKEKESVLSSDIQEYSAQIDQLAGEVATLRNREAIVQLRLDRTEARLDRERQYLNVLRERLVRSMRVLKKRLVNIYKSDEPDALTVILQADGFDDLLERYQYLTSVQEQDASITDRVHDLRDETRQLVESIRSARDEIAARKAELERTRMQLEAREADLAAVRAQKADALDQVQATEQELEGEIGDIQSDIQAQLQAAQAAAEPATPTLPAGPVQGESSSGFIWPVSGPVVSPFGWRWGRMHEGIDIAVPAGTPIRAVANGTVVLAAPTGGYGNYTCVDHGGGLASCYAHQSSYAITSGSVSQGDVIGYVGCTGSCFGDHLHFEVRVNGSAVDPMGYQ
jgi:murein DD-endopeptidase MepM/ murein hydrolase activator NlpD